MSRAAGFTQEELATIAGLCSGPSGGTPRKVCSGTSRSSGCHHSLRLRKPRFVAGVMIVDQTTRRLRHETEREVRARLAA